MQYYVDGYNLLFKEARAWNLSSLQEARTRLIHELDILAERLKLSITIVFDAPFQSDDLKRSHFRTLEIIFTAKGQTADEFLEQVAEVKQKRAVVVTSDRTLARKVKSYHTKVEPVHEFIVRLRKKRGPQPQKIVKEEKQVKKEEVQVIEKPLDMNNLPPLGDLDAWLKIFSRKRKD